MEYKHMDYLERPEGYEPLYPPYRPSQSLIQQRPGLSKQPAPQQTIKQPVKMPKARALAIARRMKQGIVVGSLLCFGTVGGVIIHQADLALAQQSTTQTTAKSSSSQGSTTPSSGSSQQTGTSSQMSTPAATSTSTASQGSTSSSQSSGSTQSGQAGTTSQQQGGGYGFGSTSSKTSVSGSHTS